MMKEIVKKLNIAGLLLSQNSIKLHLLKIIQLEWGWKKYMYIEFVNCFE